MVRAGIWCQRLRAIAGTSDNGIQPAPRASRFRSYVNVNARVFLGGVAISVKVLVLPSMVASADSGRRFPVGQETVKVPGILRAMLRLRIRRLSVDDQQIARTAMGHLVGNTPEHEAPEPAHALIPDYQEVSLDRFGDRDEHIGWITVSSVHLGRHTFTSGLREHSRTDDVSRVMQQICLSNGSASELESRTSRQNDGANGMDDMQLGAAHLGEVDGVSDGDRSSVRSICSYNDRLVHRDLQVQHLIVTNMNRQT